MSFVEMAIELQHSSSTVEEAKKRFDTSCNICCKKNIKTPCEKCTVENTHRLMIECFKLHEEAVEKMASFLKRV